MQMVPPFLAPQHPSAAEIFVFEQLAEIECPGWTYCFHGVNLPSHKRKRSCEIDFLLLGNRGLLALEVKGGGVSCEDGVWSTRTQSGSVRRLTESPFQQVQSARHHLEQQLQQEVDAQLVRRTVFGHGVVLPEVDFAVPSLEWAPEMVIDRCDTEIGTLRNALDRLGLYWEQKNGHRGPLSEEEVERYRTAIRPRFDLIPSVRQIGRRVEHQLHSLTMQQYRVLDESKNNERILIDGGAGTGKTLLAAELARRSKSSGMRTLITCRSIIITSFLRRQKEISPEDAVQFDSLDDIDTASIDMVIVDEAQDIINEQDLKSINRVLKGGLADGRWAMLLDTNNQHGLVGRYEEESMQYLTKDVRAATRHLSDNCRNTTEIVKETQNQTAADLGIATAGHGEPVHYIDSCASSAAHDMAKVLARLEAEVSLSDIVLLSPSEFRGSVFHSLPDRWRKRVDRMDLMRPNKLESGRIGFAQISDFKGLESQFVLLEAPPASDPDRSRRLLYVGMTRARAGLWVVSPSGYFNWSST